jgi:hypothetical protein
MKFLVHTICSIVLILTATVSADADTGTAPPQTISITPQPYPSNKDYLINGPMSVVKARSLLQMVCTVTKDPTTTCDIDDKQTFGLINVLTWSGGSNPTSVASAWYVYHPKSDVLHAWSQADLTTGNRFYGAKKIMLLMVELHAPGSDVTATYTLTEKKRTLENVQSLQNLISLANFGSAGGNAPSLVSCASDCELFGSSMIPLTFDAADLTFKTAIIGLPSTAPAAPAPAVVPVPAPSVNPAAGVQTLSAPAGPAPAIVPPAPGPVGGNSSSTNSSPVIAAPADFVAINEAKQWWDISIAIPIKKVNELQLNSVNNTVAPTNINRQNAFAVVDLYWPRRDLVGAAPSLIPHPMLGVSLASQPLHTLLAALGVGFSYGDLYAGAILQKAQNVSGLTAGSTATPAQLSAATTYSYQPQFSVGINISIKSALSALQKK